MVGVFLRNQSRYAGKANKSGVGNRVDEPIRELGIHPFVLVPPNDERRRVDLAVFVFVEIGAMNRARQCEQVIRAILSDERSQVPRDQFHGHVLGVGDASLEYALEQGSSSHYSTRQAEGESRGAP